MNEQKTIKAFKGFDKDLKCRGFKYEVGKEYEQQGKIETCKNGFHACENPFDVLNYYDDILNNRYCEVEQSGELDKKDNKTASSRIKIKAEIGFTGLFKAGIEWLKEVTNPTKVIKAAKGSLNDNVGDYTQIGSSGDSAKIGSSGDYAKIYSTGEDSVICCAGHNSMAKARKGSWITLAEWERNEEKGRWVPKCVKTEYVDGVRIKVDTWYKLVDGEFKEVEL